ncbi:MAG: hypothetical protein AB1515_00780 [Nitrospirota bacterium]
MGARHPYRYLCAGLAAVLTLWNGGPAAAGEMAAYQNARFGISLNYPASWTQQSGRTPSDLLEWAAEFLAGGGRREALPVGLSQIELLTVEADWAATIHNRRVRPSCGVVYRPATGAVEFAQLVKLYAGELTAVTPAMQWHRDRLAQTPPVMIVDYPVFFPDGTPVHHFDALIETQNRRGLFIVACGGAADANADRLREHFFDLLGSFQQHPVAVPASGR